MSMLKGFVVIGALVASSTAFAAPAHLSDAQYLAAARCSGLIASPALGKGDTQPIDAVLKSEGRVRMPVITQEADEARQNAMRQAGHAGAQGKAGLIAERDGVCQTFAHAGTMASGPTMGQTSSSN